MNKSKGRLIGLVTGGAIAAVIAAGGFAFASGTSSAGQYRTFTAQQGSVAQALSLTGTIASATRSDVAFSAAGTVATIDVAIGDTVTAGQVLATLDDDELADTVADAREAVASAREKLASDLEAQSSASESTSSSSTTNAQAASSTKTTPTGTVTAAVYVVRDAPTASPQPSSVAAKTVADTTVSSTLTAAKAAYDTARAAVTTAQEALIGKYDEVTGESSASDDDVADATGSEGACAAFLAVTDPADDQAATFLANCQAAILTAQGSLDRVQELQSELTALAKTLDEKVAALDTAAEALAKAATAAGQGGGSTATGGSSGDDSGSGATSGTGSGSSTDKDGSGDKAASGSGGQAGGDGQSGAGNPGESSGGSSTGSGDAAAGGGQAGSGSAAGGGAVTGGGSGAASTTTISAARILADRAEITLAKAQLAIAKQARRAGTLTSPIAGTVAAVTMSEGAEVSAGDSASGITILGTDGYVISATADLAGAKLLAVGQAFTGILSGETEPISGTVSSIGVTNSSSNATPSYAVSLAVDSVTSGLGEGVSIAVSVAIANQENVLTVPTSAVHRTGSQASVFVYDAKQATTREVEVGAVGTELTEITSGLEAGEVVVLADLQAAISADSDDESSSGLSGLGGSSSGETSTFGPPGGGFPGGGSGRPAGGRG
ncbi:hypothetical protein GCM10010401_06020 [Rarobacter faecitabidus]|uniref:HlyD family secretion protein n=1 Tax=Rarobacter faecitabidus TaxID=13243 RepID=A0A542ZTQ3_RARFA|nr:biotin/lipoyl-binding protein [Rarobacter faecitabidus]TQL63646.1 HlyD family secretion protein [Rarobacter faecitabidus]